MGRKARCLGERGSVVLGCTSTIYSGLRAYACFAYLGVAVDVTARVHHRGVPGGRHGVRWSGGGGGSGNGPVLWSESGNLQPENSPRKMWNTLLAYSRASLCYFERCFGRLFC